MPVGATATAFETAEPALCIACFCQYGPEKWFAPSETEKYLSAEMPAGTVLLLSSTGRSAAG